MVIWRSGCVSGKIVRGVGVSRLRVRTGREIVWHVQKLVARCLIFFPSMVL